VNTFVHHVGLAAPLFVLVLAGYLLMRGCKWPQSMSENLSRFVFSVALPAMLFRMMSDFSKLPPVDARLLVAFFGGCLIVFVIGRLLAWRLFALDGVGQSVFALGGVFSNNVLLGLPLAKVALGEAAVPSVALVLVFNALILWTLLSVSVEWAQHGNFSVRGFATTARGVLTNPIVAGILSGALFGLSGWPLADADRAAAGNAGAGGCASGADRSRHGAGRIRRARRLANQRRHLRPQVDRTAAGGLVAGAAHRSAGNGNAGRGAARFAGRRRQRLSDVASVQDPRRAGGEQPGVVDGPGGAEHAAADDLDRSLIVVPRMARAPWPGR
jgi:hypothetical protein